MKTKITLCILAVAVVTLSFTFASVSKPLVEEPSNKTVTTVESQPVGGLYADDAIE